jgi:hypothetical protein
VRGLSSLVEAIAPVGRRRPRGTCWLPRRRRDPLRRRVRKRRRRDVAVFLVPTQGENRGVGFRFGNGPVESEITGPYFTPDEQTLFLDVKHPGENTGLRSEPTFGDPQTYRCWWPEGNKTAGQNPSAPLPSQVAVTRVLPDTPPGSTTVPPPSATATTAAKPDGTRPLIVCCR